MQAFVSVRGLNLRGARAGSGVSPSPDSAPRASFWQWCALAVVGAVFGGLVFWAIVAEEVAR